MALLKIKHVTFASPIKPPGANPSSANWGVDSASFSTDHYELWKAGDEIWVAKGDHVISVPLSSTKRIEYFKIADTPVQRMRDEVEAPKPSQVGRPKI